MKKTNKFLMFKVGSAPVGLIALLKYRVKKIDEDFYMISGDIEVDRDLENTDYTIEEMKREGGKIS